MFTFLRQSLQYAVVLLCAALIAGTSGCSDVSGPCTVVTLTITPNPLVLVANSTGQFTATGIDVDGNVVEITSTWSVVGNGGTINATSGLFTAGATLGTFTNTVQASSSGLTAHATVIVTSGIGPLQSITVTPDPANLIVNEAQVFVATGRDAAGNIVSITPTWTVVADGGVINSGSGRFVAASLSAGAGTGTFPNTVRASFGGISGYATVNVAAAPPGPLATITVTPDPANLIVNGVQQFVAVGEDIDGNVVNITPTWSVVASGGAINPLSGMFTAGTVTGAFPNTVRASSGGVSGYATVNVSSGTLAMIIVTPNPANLAVNGIQQFTAIGRDADSNVVAISPSWSVVANGGTINAGSGLFTAGTVTGAFPNTVRATSGGMSGYATVNVGSGALSTIVVTPNPANLAVNGVQQFTATGRDANGNVVAITPTWAVVASGGAINSSSGLFTAGTVIGSFPNTVRATSGGISAFATVNVSAGSLATITVTPNPANLVVNGVQQFVATGRDANGNVVAMTPTWAVVAGGGTINSGSGMFTAGSVTGAYPNTVRASSGGLSGFATVNISSGVLASITVTPNPDTLLINESQLFVATGRDANGNIVAITPTWAVVANGGTINSGSGMFTAGSTTGTFPNTVRASSGGLSGFATVVVINAPLATITVTPNPDTLFVNGVQQFVAVGRDANGNIVPITPSWAVVAGGGSINSLSGMFTAGAVTGSFPNTVRASSGGISGFATVVVIDVPLGPLATITVTPNPDTLLINGVQQFVAVGRDANGNIVPITPAWAVVANGGTINANSGLFTAGTVTGTFTNTIRATSGAISGFATVTVIPGPLATITVTPNPDTLATGESQQFVAVGRDANGNIVAIIPTWAVVASGGAINANSGLFAAGTTTGTFSNTIRATSGGVSGFATVVVVSGLLATITVTPDPATLPINGVQQFVAVGRDVDGNIVAITPTWSVTAGGGTINSGSGLFTAGTVAGTFPITVRATSGSRSGFATVIVTPGVVSTITVTPNPDTTVVNGTQQFVATGRDANDNIVMITPVWSVVANGGTINSSSGLFTAGDESGTYNNTIRAASGDAQGFATVTLIPGALASITITPNPDTLAVDSTQLFVAVGRDADSNVVAITPVWSVVAGGGSINSGSGLFTAGSAPGSYNNTIRAMSGAVSGFATVTVIPGPLASITVSPNPDTLAVTENQQFVAVGRDADSNVVAITPVWSVVNSGGTIDSVTGLFTAGSLPGTYINTVRAMSGLISGFATVVVTSVLPPDILGTAATFAGLAGSTLTNTGSETTIFGDVGVSPGSAVVGIPIGQPTGGSIYAGEEVAAAAIGDLQTGYNTLAGMACGTNLTGQDLGGMTLAPGVYCFNSSAQLTGDLTFDAQGDPNAVFVIQIGSTLTTASNSNVFLIGTANAGNVYWQVGSSATLGTNTAFQGSIVALASVTLNTGSSLLGRALAINGGVTFDSNAITRP